MTEERKPCNNKNDCDGTVSEKAATYVQTGCRSTSPVFACDTCGALHGVNGGHMASGKGSGPSIFWKDGKITNQNGGNPYG